MADPLPTMRSAAESPARPQQLSAVVSGHKQQLGALLSERQQLLQAQAGLLRSYVMAGVPLPKVWDLVSSMS